MNILVFTDLFPTSEEQKITRAIFDFIKNWNRNHKVVVIKPIDFIKNLRKFRYTRTKIVNFQNITIIEVPFYRIPLIKLHLFTYKKILKIIDFSPEIVVGHDFIGNLFSYSFALKYNLPNSIGIHMHDIKRIKRFKTAYEKMVNTSRIVICRSPSIERKMKEIFPDHKKKITSLVSGIESSRVLSFEEYMKKSHSFLSTSKLKLITVSKFIARKNIEQILISLSELPDEIEFEYYLIGDGEEKNRLVSLTKTLNLEDKVFFPGYIKEEKEIDKYLKGSDIFILVSKKETFGLVYLEALANGCIVIGSAGTGIDGIIQNNINGFLVSPENKEDLQNRINNIVEMKTNDLLILYKNMYKTILQYKQKAQANKYLQILNYLVY
jgi:glycosyltransferase involved in cell wall biosynthesis